MIAEKLVDGFTMGDLILDYTFCNSEEDAMARTKEFDPEVAVQAAVGVFWRDGYERASLDELMKAMGIARQSLYDTFGDKRKLYLRALKRYRDDQLAATKKIFAEGRPVKKCFRELLVGLSESTKDKLLLGCLLVSANIERAQGDEEVAELLEGNQKAVEMIYRDALERAQKAGELGKKKDAAALARFFVATVQGMHAMGRVVPKHKPLAAVAAIALEALD